MFNVPGLAASLRTGPCDAAPLRTAAGLIPQGAGPETAARPRP